MANMSPVLIFSESAVFVVHASPHGSEDERTSLGVVLAANGYPGSYPKGDTIDGIRDEDETGKVFHAGTRLDESGQLLSAGGRVLCAVALGDTVSEAQQRAYALAKDIRWDNIYYRTDIGYRAIAREN